MKSAQQAFLDEHLCATGVPSEDFSVDDLLDLSNAELGDGYVEEEEEEEEGEVEKDSLSGSSSPDQADDCNSNSANFSGATESESHLASELAVPDDDVAELEWLSHFVHDDLSELSLFSTAGKQKIESRATNRSEPEWGPPCFPARVPSKARSKRCRAGKRVWRLGSPLTESSPPSSSASSPGFSSTPCLIFNNTVRMMDIFTFAEPPTKKQKKKPAVQTGGASGGSQFQRRCSHCQVQKTPQWRTGPLGAKTLCNACGVRFKSGRLFPEYRPACSPTFSGDVHSNSHRKVLEMRKRKETMTEPEPMLTQMVPSF